MTKSLTIPLPGGRSLGLWASDQYGEQRIGASYTGGLHNDGEYGEFPYRHVHIRSLPPMKHLPLPKE